MSKPASEVDMFILSLMIIAMIAYLAYVSGNDVRSLQRRIDQLEVEVQQLKGK